jgi:hypothetical protein
MTVEIPTEATAKRDVLGIALTTTAVILTLATAYIHWTLGGMMFTLTALAYTALAAGLVIPLGPLAHFRYLVRLALLGFALFTIFGWLLLGGRFDLAYLDKAIEIALVVVVSVMLVRFDGGPTGIIARLRSLPTDLLALVRRSG